MDDPFPKCAKTKVPSSLPSARGSTGTIGRVVKIRFAESISTANPVKSWPRGAVQRTDPTKSDVSFRGNNSSRNRAVCPSRVSEISVSSRTVPACSN